MNQFEAQIVLWVAEHRVPFLDVFNQCVTVLNDKGILSIIVCVLFLAFRKMRKYGIVCSLSLLIQFILNNGCLKPLIGRIRPYVVEPMIEVITHLPGDNSFPSGHTGASFAVAFAMMLVMPKKWSVPALILAALIAISRLYVGVHYPTDILAGMALGLITAFIARWLGEKIAKNDKVRKLL